MTPMPFFTLDSAPESLADLRQSLKNTSGVRARLAIMAQMVAAMGGGADEVEGADEPELSDDPNSPNYRYKDTGYIADSRKEIAAQQIKQARDAGQLVRVNSIDWDGIEKNPRAAAELITKSNLFGRVDWDAMKQGGVDPAAGFLIDRIYASIAPAPGEEVVGKGESLSGDVLERAKAFGESSTRQKRMDYAKALETIRDRLEKSKTVEAVLEVLAEIRGELSGVQLNAEQADVVAALQAQQQAARSKAAALRTEKDAVYAEWNKAQTELRLAEWEQDKRVKRGWKPDPTLDAQISALKRQEQDTNAAYAAFRKAHPELDTKQRDMGNGYISYQNDVEYEATQLREQIMAVEREARAFNLRQNPLTRGWLTFGPKFFALLNYRSGIKGSNAFAGHVANAKGGRITDWSWAEKERVAVKTATKQEVSFQLRVIEKYERKGGREVRVGSTKQLKEMLGFRDVQSGNWVLKDPNSAKFHVEQTAAAMADLSDLLGIDEKLLGFGGRLAMAFGARGSGGKNAARAHYEPVQRVINLTKMGGGGCLAHEYVHALDNVMGELVGEGSGKRDSFASVSGVSNAKLNNALTAVRNAMLTGNVRPTETIAVDDKLRQLAKSNIDRPFLSKIPQGIKDAGDAEQAVLFVDQYFGSRTDKRSLKLKKQWRTIAAAYHASADVLEVKLKTGAPTSSFKAEAMILDGSKDGKYWSTTEEMFARAFQSYVEDRMASLDRQNDYLSAYADNKFHVDPLFGIEWKPFPEGEERQRINAAFDQLFSAIRDEKVFEKAIANKALMDSIFGR